MGNINTALHVNSTAPFFSRNPSGDYFIEDFDLLTTALSALSWRKLGNKIVMATDKKGKQYYDKIGICDLWDEVVDIIPSDLEGIDPQMFWASGKILALREFNSPISLIDTDFILWDMPILSGEITVAHFEQVGNEIYPDKDYFMMKDYIFPEFNWNVMASNTAFLHINSEDFKQYYTSQAIYFMKSAQKIGDPLCYMVFAEQRLLSMCADALGMSIQPLLSIDKLWENEKFTHIWGAKQAMRESPAQRKKFCDRCLQRLREDFFEYSSVFERIIKP